MYLLTTVRQVDLVQVQPQLAGDDLGRHGLAGARRPGEEHVQPLAQRQLAVEAPVVVDLWPGT